MRSFFKMCTEQHEQEPAHSGQSLRGSTRWRRELPLGGQNSRWAKVGQRTKPVFCALLNAGIRTVEGVIPRYFMMAVGVCAADTDEEAQYLRSTQMLAFAHLRTGRPGQLPRPVTDLSAGIPASIMAQVEQALACSATGGPKRFAMNLARWSLNTSPTN